MSKLGGGRAVVEKEMGPAPALFEHSPLLVHAQEMRLLRVLPFLSTGDLVCCLMRHARFDDASYLSFDAVSYMWGPEYPCRTILVNGRIFKVRENLWDFLNTARHTRPHRWLWIDALSIAQTNHDEKAHQIRLMRDIYKLAESVLIWLGSGDEVVESLMRLAESDELSDRIISIKGQRDADKRRIAANIPNSDLFAGDNNTYYPLRSQDLGRFESVYGDDYAESDFYSVLEDLYYGDDTLLHGTYALDHNPYWSRVWIIQEVLLASKRVLLHGRWALSWQHYRALMQLFTPSIIIGKHLNVVTKSSSKNRCYGYLYSNNKASGEEILTPDKFDMVDLLSTFGAHRCALPQDHVFGILATSANVQKFPVDYDSGQVELLLNTMLFCLTERWSKSSKMVVQLPDIFNRRFASHVATDLYHMSFERSRGLHKLVTLPTDFSAVMTIHGGWRTFTISMLLKWTHSRASAIDKTHEGRSATLVRFARYFDKFEQEFSASDTVYYEPVWEDILIVRETPFGGRVIGRVGPERTVHNYDSGMEPKEHYLLFYDTYGCQGLPGTNVRLGSGDNSTVADEEDFVNAYLSALTYRNCTIAQCSEIDPLTSEEIFFDCHVLGDLEARFNLERQLESKEAMSQTLANICFTDIRAVVILFMLPGDKAMRELAFSMLYGIDGMESLANVKSFGILCGNDPSACRFCESSKNTMTLEQYDQMNAHYVDWYMNKECVPTGSKYLDFVNLRYRSEYADWMDYNRSNRKDRIRATGK